MFNKMIDPHVHYSSDPPSGFPSLRLYRKLLTRLQAIGVTQQLIQKMTYTNICETFALEDRKC